MKKPGCLYDLSEVPTIQLSEELQKREGLKVLMLGIEDKVEIKVTYRAGEFDQKHEFDGPCMIYVNND